MGLAGLDARRYLARSRHSVAICLRQRFRLSARSDAEIAGKSMAFGRDTSYEAGDTPPGSREPYPSDRAIATTAQASAGSARTTLSSEGK